jgi:small ligand-binding sensory domain FIST
MAAELGDLFRHAGERVARSLWLAEAVSAAGATSRVRRVSLADPEQGALRVEGGRIEGEVRLMRPDPPAALERLGALARRLRDELRPGGLSAGIYLASRFRGRGLFGPTVSELALLRQELGGVPLIGLVTDAEIFAGGLHEGAGILVLIGDGSAPVRAANTR